MKEYGEDLKKQLIDYKKKVRSIENKIRKRARLVLKHNYDVDEMVNDLSPIYLLRLIITVEERYTAKSKQLDMFKTNENEKN